MAVVALIRHQRHAAQQSARRRLKCSVDCAVAVGAEFQFSGFLPVGVAQGDGHRLIGHDGGHAFFVGIDHQCFEIHRLAGAVNGSVQKEMRDGFRRALPTVSVRRKIALGNQTLLPFAEHHAHVAAAGVGRCDETLCIAQRLADSVAYLPAIVPIIIFFKKLGLHARHRGAGVAVHDHKLSAAFGLLPVQVGDVRHLNCDETGGVVFKSELVVVRHQNGVPAGGQGFQGRLGAVLAVVAGIFQFYRQLLYGLYFIEPFEVFVGFPALETVAFFPFQGHHFEVGAAQIPVADMRQHGLSRHACLFGLQRQFFAQNHGFQLQTTIHTRRSGMLADAGFTDREGFFPCPFFVVLIGLGLVIAAILVIPTGQLVAVVGGHGLAGTGGNGAQQGGFVALFFFGVGRVGVGKAQPVQVGVQQGRQVVLRQAEFQPLLVQQHGAVVEGGRVAGGEIVLYKSSGIGKSGSLFQFEAVRRSGEVAALVGKMLDGAPGQQVEERGPQFVRQFGLGSHGVELLDGHVRQSGVLHRSQVVAGAFGDDLFAAPGLKVFGAKIGHRSSVVNLVALIFVITEQQFAEHRLQHGFGRQRRFGRLRLQRADGRHDALVVQLLHKAHFVDQRFHHLGVLSLAQGTGIQLLHLFEGRFVEAVVFQ